MNRILINLGIMISASLFAVTNSQEFVFNSKQTASNGAANDEYGYSVETSDNYAIVGAWQANNGAGRVYILEYDSITNVWNEDIIIDQPDSSGALFGAAVSITSEGGSNNNEVYAIISSPRSDDTYTYLYEKDMSSGSNVWNLAATFIFSNAGADDRIGQRSVSISGNFVIIGVRFDVDNGGIKTGSAFIYKRDSNTGVWSQVGNKLLADDGANGDEFGHVVSITASGNNNNDVFAIIGAHRDDDNGGDSGSAYIFEYDSSSGTFNQVSKLIGDGGSGSNGDRFGGSVDISLDDTTGEVNVIIGALGDDDVATAGGAAYIFERDNSDGSWNEVSKLLPTNAAFLDLCGSAVSIYKTIAVMGCFSQEKVYVYEKNSVDNSWSLLTTKTGSDDFGFSVSVSNKFAIVGQASDAGSVSIYTTDLDDETAEPTPAPTEDPTPSPTSDPTPSPTDDPTPAPTDDPTPSPTAEPTPAPTDDPTPSPTDDPTPSPTTDPTPTPTNDPTPSPTDDPTPSPTEDPTPAPTSDPTPAPTDDPTASPTPAPTDDPSAAPTAAPTWVTPCVNNPCDCDINSPTFEDPLCKICHSQGCSQCKNVGTNFKLDFNHPCVNCQSVFGDGCMFCQDSHGCGQCKQGYNRVYDNQENLYYCEEITNDMERSELEMENVAEKDVIMDELEENSDSHSSFYMYFGFGLLLGIGIIYYVMNRNYNKNGYCCKCNDDNYSYESLSDNDNNNRFDCENYNTINVAL